MIAAQTLADFPRIETAPPQKPEHNIWIEGENCIAQTGGSIVRDDGCYNDRAWLLFRTNGPGMAEYGFQAPAAGQYLIAVAGQETGKPWVSPVSYAIDGGKRFAAGVVPSSAVSWGRSLAMKWTLVSVVELSKGVHTISFHVDERREMDSNYAYRIDAVALLHEPLTRFRLPLKVLAAAPENVFIGVAPVFRPAYKVPPRAVRWRVTDFFGVTRAEGGWLASGDLVLGMLSDGYYRFSFSEGTNDNYRTASAIPFVRYGAVRSNSRVNPMLCIDTPYNPLRENSYASNTAQAAMLARSMGASTVRIHCSNSAFVDRDIVSAAAAYRNAGLGVSVVIHDARSHARREDLSALFSNARALRETYGGIYAAWEFACSEDDTAFTAWDFAARQKVRYLGMRSAAGGALSAGTMQHPLATSFFETALRNGISGYADAFSLQLYEPAHTYTETIRMLHAVMSHHGSTVPLWIAKNGLAYEGAAAGASSSDGTYREHDDTQERMQAEHAVKSMVTLESLGVKRNYFYTLLPYYVGAKVWGLFRSDLTPKPAYASLTALSRCLENARYAGRVTLGSTIPGFVYDMPDRTQTVVFWNDSDDVRTFSLRSSVPELKLMDICGYAEKVFPEKGLYRFTAQRYPSYIQGLTGMRVEAPFPEITAPHTDETQIVLRWNPGAGFIPNGMTSVLVTAPAAECSLDVYNFSPVKKNVALNAAGSGYAIRGMPSALQIPPMSFTNIPLRISITADRSFALSFGAACGEQPVPRVYIPVAVPFTGNPSYMQRPLSAENPAHWSTYASGPMLAVYDDAEHAIRFEASFNAAGGWMYPEFMLGAAGVRMDGAVDGVSFEIKTSDDDVLSAQAITLCTQGAMERTYQFSYMRPSTNWSTRTVYFSADAPSGFTPETVTRFRIGLHTKQSVCTFWIRNVNAHVHGRAGGRPE
ncbi:MAG: hypothetical protein HZC28_04205 [Spirochaetes bacterium]|nr:hypothetical protein [Spirochaetota bacterium]